MATTTNNGWTTPDDTAYVKDGALAIRTLGNNIDTSVGTGLLAWTAYTPTFSGMSLGNGTIDFKYAKLGKIVHVRGGCTFGSTSTMTGPLDISLPFTASIANLGLSVGQVGMFSGSSVFLGANVFVGNTGSCRSTLYSTSGSYATAVDASPTIPFTWTTNSQFFISFTYQAA